MQRKLFGVSMIEAGIKSSFETPRSIYNIIQNLYLSDVKFIINGTTGHGSMLHKNTAAEKFHFILGKMLGLRQKAESALKDDQTLGLGYVTTVNLTVVKGGIQNNVLPPVIEATFDLRLAVDEDLVGLEKQVCAHTYLYKYCIFFKVSIFLNLFYYFLASQLV